MKLQQKSKKLKLNNKQKEELNQFSPFVQEFYKKIFINKELPTIKEVEILEDYMEIKDLKRDYSFRRMYTSQCFPILTIELIKEIKEEFKRYKIKNSIELQSGIGWLSFYMKQQGIKINETIDNKSWKHFEEYLPIVKTKDSLKYAKTQKFKEQDCIILSWPYMDENATTIWNNMISGQKMLYVGEGKGGCTASDSFFDKIENEGKILKYLKNSKSFYGIHDNFLLIEKK